MKVEKLLSFLCAAAVAFCLGFGGAACMISGLGLPVDLAPLALGCALADVFVCVCFRFRRGGWAIPALTLLILLNQRFWAQAKALGRSIMNYLFLGYGIPSPAWLEGEEVTTQLLALLVIAGLVITATAWTMLRRKRSFWAVAAALLPLVSCILVVDTVPHSQWLALWLAGLVVLVLTQTLRRQDPARSNRLTGLLIVPVAAAVLGLFCLIPRENTVPLDALTNRLISGFSFDATGSPLFELFGEKDDDQVDLSALKERVALNTVVMEVTAEHSGLLYLRGRDFDVYDGLGWSATEDRAEKLYGFSSYYGEALGTVQIKTLRPHAQYYLPCYTAEDQTLTGGLAANPELATAYSYSCFALREERLSQEVVQTPSPDPQYLELPEQTRQEARALLDTQELSVDDTVIGAKQIGSYVRSLAAYDPETGPMPKDEPDFALWFIREGETGYCVHFATTAVVLLRAAGIPARYVEGYTVEVTPGQTVQVQEKMAHAWAEYYVGGIGWLILEATPGVEEAPVETPETTTATTTATTAPTTQETVTTGESAAATIVPCDDSSSAACALPEDPELPQWAGTALWYLLGLILLIFAITGQWALRRYQKLRKMYHGDPYAQALARYREIKLLSRLLGRDIPEDLTQLTQKAKFSPHTLTPKELSQFDPYLRTATRDLKRAPLPRRLAAKWLYAAY